MSMLNVARYLYFSKSIDLSSEEERFFNLSMANSGQLFSCLNSDHGRRDLSPACVRRPAMDERIPMFGRRK